MNLPLRDSLPGESPLRFLPLLPVRPVPRLVSQAAPSRSEITETCASFTPVSDDDVTGLDERSAAALYDDLLGRAACCLVDHQVRDAVDWVQRAHRWKNQWESVSCRILSPATEHWVTMSACSTVAGDDNAAASFAIQAWETAGCEWTMDLAHDFRDSSADATTLLALNRLRQRRPDRAAALLACAIDDHRIAGDIEQLMADYLLLFVCEDAGGRASQADAALQAARRILRESLDVQRHPRRQSLARWLRRYGQPRPLLLKHS